MGAGRLVALVDVVGAVGAGEAVRALALVAGLQREALGLVAAGFGGAVVDQLTVVAAEAGRAVAAVDVQGLQGAGAAVLARLAVTGVSHRDLAQAGRVADGALAGELRSGAVGELHLTPAAVLTPLAATRQARVLILTVGTDVCRRTPVKREAALSIMENKYKARVSLAFVTN